MKGEDEILARAQELVSAEVDRRFLVRRLPVLCMHNHRQPLDTRPTVNGEENDNFNTVSRDGPTIGLCMLGAQKDKDGHWVVSDADQEDGKWNGTVCEDPIDAQRCPYFDTGRSREQVIEDLKKDISNIEWVNEHMPELAALLWALDTTALPRIPWLQRVLLPFRKVTLEPLQAPASGGSPAFPGLLPPSS